jgi:hypothetical protein
MATVQRLTKRVNELEEWVKENELTGGPQGTLDVMQFLINETRMSAQVRTQLEQQVNNLRALTFEFINQHELTEEWNEFLQDKEEEAKDGEEVGEEDTKESKPSKEEKSKETKK